jgi:5-methylcytosine-specific restriction enzyme A
MAVFRWKNLPPVRRDRYGYYLCRLCKKACPENETAWCSTECLNKYLLMSSGTYVRAALLERDRGRCALCGVDGEQMNRALAQLKEDLLHPLLMTIHPLIITTLQAEGWTNIRAKGKGMYPDCIDFTSCWEADHIQSVQEGGGQCDLDNYRTLCYVCHKSVSKKQATARAQKRKSSNEKS